MKRDNNTIFDELSSNIMNNKSVLLNDRFLRQILNNIGEIRFGNFNQNTFTKDYQTF